MSNPDFSLYDTQGTTPEQRFQIFLYLCPKVYAFSLTMRAARKTVYLISIPTKQTKNRVQPAEESSLHPVIPD